eukprot:NODE_7625_length_557_cov_4.547244_g6597_i0.p4 GENE.NODE_7625_length_557_cov_4.547244_g6597_i0~~NODE_7625_length_557_cov_4.547244_g6597_i0.p4  ORF type:complete len:62 (+),score=3.26 NODE_7625_length_557_cov_4.547244_g6597_i0:48-233(+)
MLFLLEPLLALLLFFGECAGQAETRRRLSIRFSGGRLFIGSTPWGGGRLSFHLHTRTRGDP